MKASFIVLLVVAIALVVIVGSNLPPDSNSNKPVIQKQKYGKQIGEYNETVSVDGMEMETNVKVYRKHVFGKKTIVGETRFSDGTVYHSKAQF